MFDALRAKLLQPGANLGLSVVFDGLVVLSRISRGKSTGRSEAEMRGLSGAIDYEFTGDGGATWHYRVEDGRGFFHRGAHGHPLATVSLSVDQFFKLLTGHTSFMVAQMSGQVQIRGDGHAALFFGALIGALNNDRRKPGREGRFLRRWLGLAARTSGTGYRFKE